MNKAPHKWSENQIKSLDIQSIIQSNYSDAATA